MDAAFKDRRRDFGGFVIFGAWHDVRVLFYDVLFVQKNKTPQGGASDAPSKGVRPLSRADDRVDEGSQKDGAQGVYHQVT